MSRRLIIAPNRFVLAKPGYDAATCGIDAQIFNPLQFNYQAVYQTLSIPASSFSFLGTDAAGVGTWSATIGFSKSFPQTPQVIVVVARDGGSVMLAPATLHQNTYYWSTRNIYVTNWQIVYYIADSSSVTVYYKQAVKYSGSSVFFEWGQLDVKILVMEF